MFHIGIYIVLILWGTYLSDPDVGGESFFLLVLEREAWALARSFATTEWKEV